MRKHVKKEFDLNVHTSRLLMHEPFFTAISRRVEKRASYAIPTAGVCVNPESAQFEMLYNPDFFSKLSEDECRDVLKHEFYHIVFLHVTNRMPEGVNRKKWNIATDLAINSHLRNLPEGGLIPGIGHFKNMPSGKSAEWYLANMPDFGNDDDNHAPSAEGSERPGNEPGDQNQGTGPEDPAGGDSEGSGSMPDTLDNHDGWSECSQETKDIAKERLKDIVRKAAEVASASSSWGSISSSCREEIMKVLKSKVDWKKVLRYFVKTSQRADKSSSIKRINRRYPYIHSGRKTNRTAKVAVSIDQSGSVDNEMLAKFFAELGKLSDIAEFTVVPFDTKVDESLIYTWKKGQNRKCERVLHGGTCFNAPTKYVNQNSFDGHIILTDMQAPKPIASKCPRMWLTTPEHERYSFTTKEKVVIIK